MTYLVRIKNNPAIALIITIRDRVEVITLTISNTAMSKNSVASDT